MIAGDKRNNALAIEEDLVETVIKHKDIEEKLKK